MQSENKITIIYSTELNSKQQYTSVQVSDDNIPSPQCIISHDELMQIKASADRKQEAARKRKIALSVVIIISMCLLAFGLYASVQLVKTPDIKLKPESTTDPLIQNQPPIQQNNPKQQQKIVQNQAQTKETVKDTPPPAQTVPKVPLLPPNPKRQPEVAPNKKRQPEAAPNKKRQPEVAPNKKRQPEFVAINIPTITGNSGDHRPTTQHWVHSFSKYPYPTLGMPEPNTAFNKTEVGHGSEYYKYEQALDEVFKPYNDTNCQLHRYGDASDGGYLLCRNFMNVSEGLINLGVEGRDLFGCSLTSEFKIPNYQYDCTNSVAPGCPTNNNLNSFESACISAQTERINHLLFYSLEDMVRERNLTGRHVSMKIDVEGAEWPGFRNFPVSALQWVDQLVLEIHLRSGTIGHPSLWGNLDIIRSLGKEFVSVSLHMNNFACVGPLEIQQKTRFYPSFAIQVTLVNRRLIKLNSETRSYALHPQNRPNHAGLDCQLQDH